MLNKFRHEQFVTLSSYAPENLSEEEWALLQIHLAYCDSCLALFQAHQGDQEESCSVDGELLLPSQEDPLAFHSEAAERRLMDALFPSQTELAESWKTKTFPRFLAFAATAIIAFAAGFFSFRYENRASDSHTLYTKTPEPISTHPYPQVPNKDEHLSINEASELRKKLNVLEKQNQQLTTAISSANQQMLAVKSESEQLALQRDDEHGQLLKMQSDYQSLSTQYSASVQAANRQTDQAISLEARLRAATESIEEKSRLLAMDKDLLSHDREIRDLIGARNLYIADIFDVQQSGKTAKPFGRIFYTKDRSLVFYGYDLDKQPGLKQATFQAWGSDENSQSVSLGMFYQDETHKCWVLHFNDTKTLARLSRVFVTTEPHGGSSKPTGKPVLSAYLHVEPNHP